MTDAPGRLVVIRCDANDVIGGGHVMRCLTIADALLQTGSTIHFVAAFLPESLEARIIAAGHTVHRIAASPEMSRPIRNWEQPILSNTAQRADATATGATIRRADWVIVDHYLLDSCWHGLARRFAHRVFVIDDLANRSYDCDLLLDQTFGRLGRDYQGLVPANALIMAGSQFALLRPEFKAARPASLARRRSVGRVEGLLVSLGTADIDGITGKVVETVAGALPDCRIDVVLGPNAPSLGQVRQLAAANELISVHVDSDRMADLMRDADIAIGAAGVTSWERCCLGLPTATLVLADNQKLVASNLERVGAAIYAAGLADLPTAVIALADDPEKRLAMSAAAAAIVDGMGTSRAIDAIAGVATPKAHQLTLRTATATDKELLWLWRNDPQMRSMAKSTDPVSWPTHEAWYDKMLQHGVSKLYIAESEGEGVAMVRFDRHASSALVSLNVSPNFRGQGIGPIALIEACKIFGEEFPEADLVAEIRTSNTASISTFIAAGFCGAGEVEGGIATYVRKSAATAAIGEGL